MWFIGIRVLSSIQCYGMKGTRFYIILQGSISVLIPTLKQRFEGSPYGSPRNINGNKLKFEKKTLILNIQNTKVITDDGFLFDNAKVLYMVRQVLMSLLCQILYIEKSNLDEKNHKSWEIFIKNNFFGSIFIIFNFTSIFFIFYKKYSWKYKKKNNWKLFNLILKWNLKKKYCFISMKKINITLRISNFEKKFSKIIVDIQKKLLSIYLYSLF